MADLSTKPENDGVDALVEEALRVWRHNDTLKTALSSPDRTHSDSPQRTLLDFIAELEGGTRLSLTFDHTPIEQFRSRLGNRLLFWPSGFGRQQRISVVSSRLSERKDLHRRWFDALRTIAVRCHPQQECLCVVEGTAAFDAVSRAAALFGVPLLKIKVGTGRLSAPEDLITWCRSVMCDPSEVDSQSTSLWISPEFVASEDETGISDSSVSDAASILIGDRVVALSCREGGTIQRLLLDRLQQEPKPTVLLVDEDQQTSASTRTALADAGAVRWLLEGQQQAYSAVDPIADVGDAGDTVAALSPVVLYPDEWLCHWTRPRRGPWPDESVDDYWDALIMGCASADHSALGALLRIIETRQLLPSEMSHGAVSWTAVPLSEFSQRRIYRRHLRRYDFEPWGIAVRRSALSVLGCRPVTYVKHGDKVEGEPWQTHPATDAAGKIDWTTEREWRIPECVDLSAISVDDIVLFVDSEAEAAVLRQASPWSVICVPRD